MHWRITWNQKGEKILHKSTRETRKRKLCIHLIYSGKLKQLTHGTGLCFFPQDKFICFIKYIHGYSKLKPFYYWGRILLMFTYARITAKTIDYARKLTRLILGIYCNKYMLDIKLSFSLKSYDSFSDSLMQCYSYLLSFMQWNLLTY